jgi:protein-L-isoaspartate(D-aspartate) O-methyltransferase
MAGDSNGDADADGTDRAADRDRLVDRLLAAGHVERASTERALRAVPRHAFVPGGRRDAAYADRPLPIGGGQTISAPHMVAAMCDLLDLEPGERVLEVGTGCGYHAAVTAELVGPGNVYSVEYDPELARVARARLERLGYDVHVRAGDGHEGWPEGAPYDAAYLTCAAGEFPAAVVEQVRPGGRLLGPLGGQVQTLVLARKRADGTLEETEHGGVRFVPMRGGR